MKDKYYDIYFDRWDLEVDEYGVLRNSDALRIIEFEYDEETDEVVSCRRVSENGAVIEEEPDLRDLDHAGYGDDPTIGKALGRFEGWLLDNIEWRCSSRETYWQPAEYVCIGVTGCVE